MAAARRDLLMDMAEVQTVWNVNCHVTQPISLGDVFKRPGRYDQTATMEQLRAMWPLGKGDADPESPETPEQSERAN